MRIAAMYTLWNGLELLEKSIEQIYDDVDTIILCWQLYSNKAEKSNEIVDFIKRFEQDPKIHLIEYTPSFISTTKQNERAKLQMRIDYAKTLGCTHFFSAACDHYYEPEQFRWAKNECSRNMYGVTFTRMATYYKHPTWKLEPLEDYFMPFICKLYESTTVVKASNYHVRVDPSIQISPANNPHVFGEDEILMHHFSMIRQDIGNKFRNAAASIRWKPEQVQRFLREYRDAKPGDEISYFQKRKIVEVPNMFDI